MKKGALRNPKPDVHFRITAEQLKRLQVIAKEMDRSVSYLIAQIVREWLEKKEGD